MIASTLANDLVEEPSRHAHDTHHDQLHPRGHEADPKSRETPRLKRLAVRPRSRADARTGWPPTTTPTRCAPSPRNSARSAIRDTRWRRRRSRSPRTRPSASDEPTGNRDRLHAKPRSFLDPRTTGKDCGRCRVAALLLQPVEVREQEPRCRGRSGDIAATSAAGRCSVGLTNSSDRGVRRWFVSFAVIAHDLERRVTGVEEERTGRARRQTA